MRRTARQKMLDRIEAGCYCGVITKDGYPCARAPVDTVSGACKIHEQRERKSDKASNAQELVLKTVRNYLPQHEIDRLEYLAGQSPGDSLQETVINARLVLARIHDRNKRGLYKAETYVREFRAAANHLARMEETALRVRQLAQLTNPDDADDPAHTFDPANEDPNDWPDQ